MIQLTENTLFHARYLLKKQLGSGGFSEVWLVEDTKVGNKKMALKVYAPGKGLDDDGVQLFSSEFEVVFDLNHSHLLRPAHFDVCDRSPYLVLPYCERGAANKLVGNITEEEAWRVLHDVASGLAYLHEQEPPVIHQDIKPDNVLIDKTGKFLITDFGISAKARSTLRKSIGETKSGGTIAYMPPERFGKDNKPIKASDVWALGATLFELLTGDVPFGEHGGLIQKSGAEIPNIDGQWSNNLLEIVNQCLLPEPWDRPTTQQIVDWTEARLRGEKINPAARTDGASPVSSSRQIQPQTQTPPTDPPAPTRRDDTSSPARQTQPQTQTPHEADTGNERTSAERSRNSRSSQTAPLIPKKRQKLIIAIAAAVLAICVVAGIIYKGQRVKQSVLINGVRWATCNVNKPGTFVARPEDAGMLYQWNRKTGWSSTDPMKNSNGGTTWDDSDPTGTTWAKANDPSPAGYRLPTKKELESLADENYVTQKWTTKNGINGYLLTDKASGNALFLPAAGYRNGSYGSLYNAGSGGTYWSSTQLDSNDAYNLNFLSGSFYVSFSYHKTDGFSVRCVAEP